MEMTRLVIERTELTKEYIRRYSNIIHLLLKCAGYSYFTIKDGKFVEKTLGSVIYGGFVIIWAIATAIILLYELALVQNYMYHAEIVITIEVSILIISFVTKITFASRDIGAKLINNCIEIDLLLGKNNTQFLRNLEGNAFLYLTLPIFINQLIIVISLYVTFKVSYFIHFIGTAYFYWAFFAFYDTNMIIYHSLFISLRARYFNVALMKLIKMPIDHIPTGFFSIIWKSSYDELVELPETPDKKTFVKVLNLIYRQFHYFNECYSFTIFSGVVCITVGSLFTVQGMIAYDRTSISALRKSVIAGWLIISWLVFLTFSITIDTFPLQINQTKLICIYSQLTASHSEPSEANLSLTKSILSTLEVKDTRMNVYGVFYVDYGTVYRVAMSTFVYITAYLQLTMTMNDETRHDNGTSTLPP